MVVCRFFEKGRCNYGEACRNEHIPPAVCSFFQRGECRRGTSCRFKHVEKAAVPQKQQKQQQHASSSTVCVYFQRGVCKRGTDCYFRHDAGCEYAVPDTGSAPATDASTTATTTATSKTTATPTPNTATALTVSAAPHHEAREEEVPVPQGAGEAAVDVGDGSSCVRSIRGATVEFGDGAAVQSVSLRSDFSTLQLANVAPGVDAERLAAFVAVAGGFAGDGKVVSASCVQLRQKPDGTGQTAEVTVEDASFAQRFLQRAGARPDMHGRTLTATQMQVAASDAGAERLQLSTVSCVWFRASRIAWLHFDSQHDALAAVDLLNRRKIRRRAVQPTYQPPPAHAFRTASHIIHSVSVGNLHVGTTWEDFRKTLPGNKLKRIKWGRMSYAVRDEEADELVRRMLEESGRVCHWEVVDDQAGTRARATARFVSAEDARTAAARLNGRKVPRLGNTALHVSAITSVKLSVHVSILDAVQTDMDELRARVWESDHTHIKIYEAPAHKEYTAVRTYGGDRKAVAKAKGAVERVLAGTVATHADGQQPIQDPFFFRTAAGVEFVQRVMRKHSVLIHSDAKKMLLRIYGRPDAVAAAQAELQTRHSDLARAMHTIALTPQSLAVALRGGFKRLVEAFGKDAVKIDIASDPKTVTIRGPAGDFDTARALLDAAGAGEESIEDGAAALARLSLDAADGVDNDDVCAVCWTTADDAVQRQSCRHTYCRDCLVGQCASANGAGSFPIRCLGGGGGGGSKACNEVMTLKELVEVLPATDFEALLQTSFAAYVQVRLPNEFQLCPTPDCDRVFRSMGKAEAETEAETESRAVVLLCDECLADICTACHSAAHDGLTCAEAKDLADEGELAFRRWRAEHDVRACPKCDTMIEKTYGCNHMTCGGCGAHICWFCMAVLPTGEETYTHMGRAHAERGQGF